MNSHDAARERVLERLLDRADKLWHRLQECGESERVALTRQLATVDRFIDRYREC